MTMHLAELNIGRLVASTDDPRVKDFMDNLDFINGIGKKMPGFVWMMPEDQMEAAQNDPNGPMDAHPRLASTLSVWEDVASLEHFVWNTVHKRFYDRKGEWYGDDKNTGPRLVMWWVPEGHKPSIEEAKARLDHLAAHGDSDHAFGWAHLKAARLWRAKQCEGVAA